MILANPDAHEGRSYRPTGPQLLSAQEMAAIIEKIAGHRVRPIDLPAWMLGKVARMQGIDPFTIYSLLDYMNDHKRGVFEFEGGVNDTVRELTGSPAEDFETTARRYAALPFARKNFLNRTKALVNFMLTPFWPGYDFKRYEREHEFPMPERPTLSAESEFWKAEHATEAICPTAEVSEMLVEA